jgi:hypothetical protein
MVGAVSGGQAVRAPELSYVRRMEQATGGLQHHGDYAIWTGSRDPSQAPYVLHEWCDKGVLPIPHRTGRAIVHRVAQGTPYHVSGLFGFWIEHDVDATWLESPGAGGSHYALMVGGTAGTPSNTTCLFVCPKCAAPFGRLAIGTSRQGFERFLDEALKHVRSFNADAKARTCPQCSAVHPQTYGFHAEKDEPVESTARAAP